MRSRRDHGFLSAACAAALLMALPSPSGAIEPNLPLQAAGSVPIPASQLPAPPANGEMGFVLQDFSYAVYPGMKENCPTGWSATNREQYLGTVSPGERARLLKPENEVELTDKWKAYAVFPDGRNVCSNLREFPDRPLRSMVQSKVAYGLNLDGDDGNGAKDPWVCTHDTFTSPTGERSVDNQMYRAQGCTRQWRGPDGTFGEIVPGQRNGVNTGETTTVLLLRGVDNLDNDDNVEVILASGVDQPIVDQKQNFIANASYTVTPFAEWRNVFKAKIVNGVLVTNAVDVYLRRKGVDAPKEDVEPNFARARMKLTFRPDGSLEGAFGGYQALNRMGGNVAQGRGTALVAGIDCASGWNTYVKLADGDRDPKTGQCRAISAAYNLVATPAFVFDRPPKSSKTASAE